MAGRKRTNEQSPADGLTDLQRAFINEYFLCNFNGVEAAGKAGYKGNYSTLAAIASENLKKPKIRDEIDRRMSEHAMRANEAISRLAAMARGDLGDLLKEDGTFDFAEAKKRGVTYLIKEYERIEEDGKVRTKLKLEDRQSAINTIIKELRLDAGKPTDRTEIVENMSDDERATRIAALLDRARARRDGQASAE
jgi:phage terminase small subunit